MNGSDCYDYRISFWGDENVLIVVVVCVYNKNHLSLHLNRRIVCVIISQ